jgi:hypothetical protein
MRLSIREMLLAKTEDQRTSEDLSPRTEGRYWTLLGVGVVFGILLKRVVEEARKSSE